MRQATAAISICLDQLLILSYGDSEIMAKKLPSIPSGIIISPDGNKSTSVKNSYV